MKYKNLLSLSMLLLLQFMLFSCQHEEDLAPREELVPLQVGNQWTYQVINYMHSGEAIDTTLYRRAVLGDTIIHNNTWYVLSDGYIVQNSNEGYVYYNRGGDVALILYQNASYGGIGYGYQYPEYLMYVLTTRVNTLALIENAFYDFMGYTFEIENQYSSPNSPTVSSFQKDYVSPDVGLVRSDSFYGDTGKLMRRYELVNYQIY